MPCHCTRSTISLACTDFQQVRICFVCSLLLHPFLLRACSRSPLIYWLVGGHTLVAASSHVRLHSIATLRICGSLWLQCCMISGPAMRHWRTYTLMQRSAFIKALSCRLRRRAQRQ